MPQLPLKRGFSIIIAMVLGEILFAIGLAYSSLEIVLRGEASLRAIGAMVTGAALLIVASRVNPSKHPPLYGFFLRPLALACLIVVASTLRLPLAGTAIPPSLLAAALIAMLLGVAAVVAIRRVNNRTKEAAA